MNQNKNTRSPKFLEFDRSFRSISKAKKSIKSEPVKLTEYFRVKVQFPNIQVIQDFKTKLLNFSFNYPVIGVVIEKTGWNQVTVEMTGFNDVLEEFLSKVQIFLNEKLELVESNPITRNDHSTVKKIKPTREPYLSKNSSGEIPRVILGFGLEKSEENVIGKELSPKLQGSAINLHKTIEEQKSSQIWHDKYLEHLESENKRLLEENKRLVDENMRFQKFHQEFKTISAKLLNDNEQQDTRKKFLELSLKY